MGLSVSNNTLLVFEPTRFGNAPSSGLVTIYIYIYMLLLPGQTQCNLCIIKNVTQVLMISCIMKLAQPVTEMSSRAKERKEKAGSEEETY